MKKKSIKLLVVLACVLMALGMAGCGKKAYKTFPEKYKLASVDVGGMTADEAKKAIKTAVGKYKISVKLDDTSFDMTAEDLGLKYNDKADLQELINAANKDKEPEKQVKLVKMDKSDELETTLISLQKRSHSLMLRLRAIRIQMQMMTNKRRLRQTHRPLI